MTTSFTLSKQAIEAAHVTEEWVDHALSKSKEEEACWFAATKAQALVEKKEKEALTKLAETEKGRKSTKAVMAGFEKQADEHCVQL